MERPPDVLAELNVMVVYEEPGPVAENRHTVVRHLPSLS
jgi:hypothetical protein